jgi:Tfp pilus assembly protein PilN
MAVLGAWLVRSAVADGFGRLQARVEELEGQRFVLESQMQAAGNEQRRLVEAVRALDRLRPEQPWPARLAKLAATAPEGIVLSELAVEGRRLEARAGNPAPATAERQAPTPRREAAGGQDVRIRGMALDHGDVARLVDALRGVPDWSQVEIVNALRQGAGQGRAVAFELRATITGSSR